MHIDVHIYIDRGVQNPLRLGRQFELSKLISFHVFTPDTPSCVFSPARELKAEGRILAGNTKPKQSVPLLNPNPNPGFAPDCWFPRSSASCRRLLPPKRRLPTM